MGRPVVLLGHRVDKDHLKKVLVRAHVSLLMLQTLVVEIEALLNDRLLTYIYF